MSGSNHLVESLFAEFTSRGVDLVNFGKADLKLVEKIVQPLEPIIWINDGIRSLCHYLNDSGRDYYYGIQQNHLAEMGNKVYQLMMHPDHFEDFYKAVDHWESYPKEIYNTTFRVKNKEGDWRWTHSSSKALNFTDDGKPEYILSVVHDIEEIIYMDGRRDEDLFVKENKQQYESLTKREKEVLQLIASELTTTQIAQKLGIESSTVDTHRKNMIRKLGVRSSLGLVRFYLIFEGKL